MDELILHIGHQKTGTTSLQKTFAENYGLLEQAGLAFPVVSEMVHHSFVRSFIPKLAQPIDAKDRAAVLAALSRTKAPRGMISAETMSRMGDEEAEAIISFLRPLASRLTILLYARNPVDFTISGIHESVRNGRPLIERIEQPPFMRYRQILERWVRLAGRENVHVRVFDKAVLVEGDIVDDVLHFLGLAALGPKLSRTRFNDGLSVVGIHVLDAANRISGKRPDFHLVHCANAIAGPRFVPPHSTLATASRRAAKGVEYLEAEFGIAIPERDPWPIATPCRLQEEELSSLARMLLDCAQARRDRRRAPVGRSWRGAHQAWSWAADAFGRVSQRR